MRSELFEPKLGRETSRHGNVTASRASTREALDHPGLAPRLVDAALAADSDDGPVAVQEDKPSLGALTAELRELQARQEQVLAMLADTLP
ncbi:MAG: hypothetical protein AAGA92_15360 [Planctomycetota bacterium]